MNQFQDKPFLLQNEMNIACSGDKTARPSKSQDRERVAQFNNDSEGTSSTLTTKINKLIMKDEEETSDVYRILVQKNAGIW
jgi:hypothetical protein